MHTFAALMLSLAWLCFAAPARAADAVDLELVLAVDISGSIDIEEARLQREGYIAALTDPLVLQAIQAGVHGRIAVTYFEWADSVHQRLVVDWRVIEDADSARAFADELGAISINTGLRTSISGAIEYAVPMFDRNAFAGLRRVIDISGDGPNNNGDLVAPVRDAAIARGITINGLPILNERPNRFGFPTSPDLDHYYEGCVIGGPGAFIVVAESFRAFAAAIRRKLLLEIAGLQPPPARRTTRPSFAQIEYEPGCDVGERQSLEHFRRQNPY